MSDLAFLPAWELRGLLRRRKLSPVELVDALLERIHALNPRLNAYLTVCDEEARSAARAAERALAQPDPKPTLLGVPLSVKDLIFTKGVRTTGGSMVYVNFVPQEDATVVERVKAAGAIILGKTNTPEFGQSATTENMLEDDCRNPWDPERTTGGSSGGAAAALAAGLGPLAIGSDGGGSIRVPSAFCGVYGIKPTQGRVSSYGGFSEWPLLSQNGPMARTVRDAALLLQVIAGPDPRYPTSLLEPVPDFVRSLRRGVRGLKAAWSPDLGYAAVDPEVRAAAEAAARTLEDLGCPVEEADLKLEEPFAAFGTIVLADDYATHAELLDKHADVLMPYVRTTLARGKEVMGHEYSLALRSRERLQAQVDRFFQRYDLLLTPATAVPAFPLRERPSVIAGRPVGKLWGAFPFTTAFNLSGNPAASVPCGFSRSGLPLGLQIVGRRGQEAVVLRASAALEEARPWAERRPPI